MARRATPTRLSHALLLDEVHSPIVAEALCQRGHDVISVTRDPNLRSMSDAALWEWADASRRRIVTENVRDFRALLLQAEESGARITPLLFTSSRSFPRSRRNPGPLIEALDAWLRSPPGRRRTSEAWLGPVRPH